MKNQLGKFEGYWIIDQNTIEFKKKKPNAYLALLQGDLT